MARIDDYDPVLPGLFIFLCVLLIFFFPYQTYALITKDRSFGDTLTGIAFISAVIIAFIGSIFVIPSILIRKDEQDKKKQQQQVPQ